MRSISSGSWVSSRIRIVGAVTALLAALGAASIASAQDERLGLSLGLAPGVRWVSLPEVRAGLVEIPFRTPYGSTPASALGWGLDGFIAYALPDGGVWVGESAGVAIRVRTTLADAISELPIPPSPGLYGQMPIDGSGTSGGAGGVARANSSLSFARYDVDLVYETVLPFGDAFRLRPLIGFAFSRVDQGHAFDSAPSNGFRIVDQLATNSFGGVLGLGAVVDLSSGVYLDLGAEADLLAAQTELTAAQNFGGSLLSAADEREEFIVRVRGRLGLGWAWNDRLRVGLEGSADWGRLHTVVHPLFDAMPFESFIDTGDSLVVAGSLTFSGKF